jgi:hypothetical protein
MAVAIPLRQYFHYKSKCKMLHNFYCKLTILYLSNKDQKWLIIQVFKYTSSKSCPDTAEFCIWHDRTNELTCNRKRQQTLLLTCDRANCGYRYAPPMMPTLNTNKAVSRRQTVVAVEIRRARALRIKYCGCAWAAASRSTLGDWNIQTVTVSHKHDYLIWDLTLLST